MHGRANLGKKVSAALAGEKRDPGVKLSSGEYMNKTASVVSIVLLLCLDVQAGKAATANASATATIETSIEIIKDHDKKISATGGDLDFGIIIADNAGGTVTIDPTDGKRHSSKKTSDAKKFGPAAFIVRGAKKKIHSIVLPNTPITAESNGNKMTVDELLSNIAVGTIDDNGESGFMVGGTLHVNPDQPSGTYTGSFVVSAAYN